MKKFIGLLLVVAFAGGLRAGETAKLKRPVPGIEHVLIISVDGLRPDRLLLADTPVLHALIKGGTYTMWAKTTGFATTLPSHTSMLTGTNPRRHGIEWNADLPLKEVVYPKYPTIFEVAKKAGCTTAFVSGKSKFEPLVKPGTLDYTFVPHEDLEVDEPVCDVAVKVIAQLKPDLLFVHFPADDKVGHKYGWGSAEQLAAIARADACIGRILAALEQAGIRRSTFVIVTSDHGGEGKTHGPNDDRSRNIPWIASGPGVKADFDLTQIEQLDVRTEDTAATALYLLGLPLGDYLEGKPVLPAFENVPMN
jgi:predicted AlkP superfamily pyrophosphatase or phosphodiesterase